jgi:hypothetical protein
MKKLHLLIIFSLFTIWISCDGDDKNGSGCKDVKTMTLQPDNFSSRDFSENDAATFSCFPATCFHSHGLACVQEVDTNVKLQVGHRHNYDNGTDPCNCWNYVDCVYRGGVSFDLSQLSGKSVVGAKLRWNEKGKCATRLFTPSAPWSQFNLVVSEEIITNWDSNTPTGAGEMEVGPEVREWVDGTKTNRGFLFVGDHHSFPHKEWIESSAEIGPSAFLKCISPVGGLSLEVLYTD